MSVNRFKIRFDSYTTFTGGTINIPVNMGYQLVDQDELVKDKFVKAEVIKNTNPIIDYEKVRFTPSMINGNSITITDNITYKLNFLNSAGQFNPDTYYSDLGFINPDIKFRKKTFTDSFLFLSFYDTDNPLTQKLLLFMTVYPKIDYSNYSVTSQPPWGTITPVNNLKVHFNLGNNILNRNLNSQGFFIYHYYDEVEINLPKVLYMRASFNNAKNGKTTTFMSTSNYNLTIDNLIRTTEGTSNINNVFTKYILIKNNTGYYYEIDTTYSSNVTINNNDYIVNLYETTVL
jgi:hypothetical protein